MDQLSATASYEVGPRDRRARIAVAGAYLVQGFCFAGLLTQVATLQRKFGFDDTQLSLVLLAVPVVSGVGSVVAGLLSTRFGSSPVLRVGGPGVALAIALTGFAAERWHLYLALVFVGFMLGLVDATMNMQGVGVERRYGRPVLNSFHAVWSAGAILGALATSGTARLHLSIGESLATVAVIGAILAVIAGRGQLRRSEEALETPAATQAAVEANIPWRPIVLIGIAMMLMFIADSAVSNWSSVFIEKALHAGTSVAALGLAAYQTTMLLGRTAGDRLVSRFSPTAVVSVGGVVGGLGLILVAVSSTPALSIAGFAVVGLGLSLVVPQSFSAAGRLDPAGTGIAIARVNLFNYVGFIVGAGLIGAVAESLSLRWAFVIPAVLAAGIVVLAPAFRTHTPPADVAN
ncbi:MFS transporter [Dactylosporangium matsuzakiense]|uniref:MFS transporter n=1 Tax=Dactylosporangium matsuzakiense TaxID=53360 RepID=A0A9W6KIG3_9ACTN|nr:MFS transporter [Dactylosporangium matsuzakiense]UWZ46827.1 MFS transporter [Dactylosporangium matsuzakiense]GLL01803.1 MFS transporter [Dactylosporangium matsuzakiense]